MNAVRKFREGASRFVTRLGVVAAPALVAANSAYAVVDTTDIEAAITDAATAGAVVGAAVVVMIVGIKVFKWLRRAL
jgi:hypothetical protein